MGECVPFKEQGPPKVVAWLNHVKLQRAMECGYTLDALLAELDEAKHICRENENYGAMVQAIVSKGKFAGHMVERTADLTPADPLTTLTELAKISPEAAEALAKQYGYEWTTVDEGSVH